MISRLFYKSNCDAYLNKLLLIESNNHLEAKIEKNERLNRQLEKLNKQLRKMTIIDKLTNIPNRRGSQQYISGNLPDTDEEIMLLIMIIDIDDFKLFNDHYGHLEVDRVISMVAHKIQECMEECTSSMTARFGVEEFVAIFDVDECTIYEKTEEIRKAVLNTKFQTKYSTVSDYVTVSISITTGFVKNEEEFVELLEKAGRVLYNAKSKRKNRWKDWKKVNHYLVWCSNSAWMAALFF